MSDYYDEDEEEHMIEAQMHESDNLACNLFQYGGLAFIVFTLGLILFLLSSCTVNQNMTLSDGNSSGNLKDSTTTTAEPDTNLTVPLKG